MNKRILAVVSVVGVLILGTLGATNTRPQSSSTTNSSTVSADRLKEKPQEIVKPTCDGEVVTNNCTIDGTDYITYTYVAAVAEKSHTETITTYREEITSYCTLCNDGTYSPSCATGRGACSHHDGVAQWNAPRYNSVPEYTTKTIIDAPAQQAYYNKVLSK